MTVAWFYNLLLALLILPFLFLSFFSLISILWLFRVKESTLVCEMVSFKFIAGLRKWLVLLSLLVLVQQYLTRERQFYKIEGKSLLGNVTAVMKVKDFFRCCFLCMQYGPVACLSFNLERNNNSIHTCELSSSEKYLEPQKMRRRLDYDYYGTEFQVWWPKPTHLGRLALRVGNFIIPIQWKTCLLWQRSVYFFNTFERGGNAATFSHSLGWRMDLVFLLLPVDPNLEWLREI